MQSIALQLRIIALLLSAPAVIVSFSPPVIAQECCKRCSAGQPCGDACISKKKKCHKPKGCACGSDEAGFLVSHLFLTAAAATPLPSSQNLTVVDGDTIVLNGESIRLEGIDAPETKQRCKNASGKDFQCGREARRQLERLIDGETVTCKPTGHDRYGRTIAYCSAGAVDINREMVADGWARAFVKYNAVYQDDETAARRARAGFWASSWEAPWDWRAAQLAAYAPLGRCIIKGNISRGQNIYFLPFHVLYDHVRIEEAKGERWFCTEDEALAAGWRRALR